MCPAAWPTPRPKQKTRATGLLKAREEGEILGGYVRIWVGQTECAKSISCFASCLKHGCVFFHPFCDAKVVEHHPRDYFATSQHMGFLFFGGLNQSTKGNGPLPLISCRRTPFGRRLSFWRRSLHPTWRNTQAPPQKKKKMSWGKVLYWDYRSPPYI